MTHSAIVVSKPWDRPFWKPVRGKEGVFTYLILIHVLATVGIISFPIPTLKVLGFTVFFTCLGGLGTTVCYHRLLAHRTLKVNRFVEQVLIFWAIFNGSGHPASWSLTTACITPLRTRPMTFPAQSRGASGGRICAGSINPHRQTASVGVPISTVASTESGGTRKHL